MLCFSFFRPRSFLAGLQASGPSEGLSLLISPSLLEANPKLKHTGLHVHVSAD